MGIRVKKFRLYNRLPGPLTPKNYVLSVRCLGKWESAVQATAAYANEVFAKCQVCGTGVCWFARAAMKKYHRLGDINNRNLLVHCSGG